MIVDRIEGDLAVVEIEKGRFENVPVGSIEGDVRDGAVLVERDGGYVVDEDETKLRSEAVHARLNSLFNR